MTPDEFRDEQVIAVAQPFVKGKGKGKGDIGADDLGPRWPAGTPTNASGCVPLRISAEFYPNPGAGRFTTLYDAGQQCNFASLNAGDGALFVGGAAMNYQFARDLASAGQATDKYKDLHARLFGAARNGVLFHAPADMLDPNVAAALVLKPANGSKVGVVFIDIFHPEKRPHGCGQNMAMIYTVGPQRRNFDNSASFLEELRKLAQNVADACGQYNASAATHKIEKVRVGLVSGGAFAGEVPKKHVAIALCQGLNAGASEQRELNPIFEFSYDEDVFKQAWKALFI